MTIEWKRSEKYLVINGTQKIPCSCDVRTLANGRRRRDEIIRTIPGGKPFDPQPFPVGQWTVTRPRARSDEYRAPYFIPTDAFQDVPIWSVEGGLYRHEISGQDRDREYGLHYSTSKTTQGCIRIDTKEDLLDLVRQIISAIDAYEPVRLTVTD
jgi:hypothetical protein